MVLNFCSNNYLGLANHPRLVEAAKQAIDQYGVGPAAVRIISGTTDLHIELERRLANSKASKKPSLSGGLHGQPGARSRHLVGKEDVIFSDRLNHASIIDGSRLSGAAHCAYDHNDVTALEAAIKENAGTYRRGLIVTDGVFSMDGDIAPLPDLYEVARSTTPVDGGRCSRRRRSGQGRTRHCGSLRPSRQSGYRSRDDVQSLRRGGRLAAGNKTIIEWLRQRGRPFLFSSAVMTLGGRGRLHRGRRLLEDSTELVDKLWDNANYFKAEMKQLGFDIGVSQTPITPVMLGEAPWRSSSAASCLRRASSPWRSASRRWRRARRASA